MRKTSRCCRGRQSRARPGCWRRYARGAGCLLPPAAPRQVQSLLRPTAPLTDRGPCSGCHRACSQPRGRRGGAGRGQAAAAFAFAFPSVGPFWFPAAFPRSHVARLFPARRSPSRRRACALRAAAGLPEGAPVTAGRVAGRGSPEPYSRGEGGWLGSQAYRFLRLACHPEVAPGLYASVSFLLGQRESPPNGPKS